MRDEALFCCGISREIPPALLNLKRVLDTIEATQEVPQHTRLHSKETARVLHSSRRAPVFHPHPERRVHFPASWESNPGIPVAPQEEAVST